MENWIDVAVLGLAVNAAYGLGRVGLSAGWDRAVKSLKRPSRPPEPLSLASEDVSRLARGLSETQSDLIQRCLGAPEVVVIVSQIYSYRVHQSKEVLQTASQAFEQHLIREVGAWVQPFAEGLWRLLVETCNRVLTSALDDSGSHTLNKLATFRHHVLLQELSIVQDQLSSMVQVSRPSIESILKFETALRSQVGRRHSLVSPARFIESRRLPIDEIYVTPNFRHERQTLTLVEMLRMAHRVVILGQPGGGKSTLAQKICRDLSVKYEERLACRRYLTPILVVLREYGEAKERSLCSVRQFLESITLSNDQVTPPTGAFEYLLDSGRLLVIFDGLDELVDPADRQMIRDDIESFSSRYPHAAIIVTTREVGYEQAPLNKSFSVLRLMDFIPDQVEEYVNKWFRSDEELSTKDKKNRISAFIRESSDINDIRSNPLMLALLCNLYRYDGFFPENRPRVFQRCSEMLFERWDKARRIKVQFSFEREVSPAVKYLAYWIASDQTKQSGVPERELVSQTTRFLLERRRRFSDPVQAEQTAREFIDFCCKGRAWVLSATGTRSDGEFLYQFTHRTFLEYFAASFLERNFRTGADLVRELSPRIAKREWDMISQLAFQLHSDNTDNGADDLLRGLLDLGDDNSSNVSQYLSLACRSLSFLEPSEVILSEITIRTLQESVKRIIQGSTRHFDLDLQAALLRASKSNRPLIAKMIRSLLQSQINGEDENLALAAFELAHNLEDPLRDDFFIPDATVDSALINFWSQEGRSILCGVGDKVRHLALTSTYACQVGVNLGLVSLAEFCRINGAPALFRSCAFPYVSGTYLQSIGRMLTLGAYDARYRRSSLRGETRLVSDLSEVGQILQGCAGSIWAEQDYESIDFDEESMGDPLVLEPNALFGLFCLIGVWSEDLGDRLGIPRAWWEDDLVHNSLMTIVAARFEDDEYRMDLASDLATCGFSLEQRGFVLSWVAGTISFLRSREQ